MIKAALFTSVATVGLVVGAYMMVPGILPGPIARAGDALTAPLRDPDKLGWMDDARLADADRARIADLAGRGYASDVGVIHDMQAGSSSAVTRRDFELLRQDRRRARAAYPNVSEDDLYGGTWLAVDIDSRVPDSFCSGGNSNGTEVGGKWYLDGGCYVSIVNPRYTKRADAATTKRVLTEIKAVAERKELKHLDRWGYDTWMGGTGGSLSVHCYPAPLPSDQEADDQHVAGQCVALLNDTRYSFPFVAKDWIDPPFDAANIKKLAISRKATISYNYKPEPKKPWVRENGSLARGQTCAPHRLCNSWWNHDRDDYDNVDIGPDAPTCWSMPNGLFGGLFYAPCSEARSTPGSLWTLSVAIYGYPDQASSGWTEKECKAEMPKYLTGMSFGMQGQDPDTLNRGKTRETRCFQAGTERVTGQVLAARKSPVLPAPSGGEPRPCVQGGTLMPGQSCSVVAN